MAKKGPTLEILLLEDLVDHPDQAAFFGDLPDGQFEALVEDIKANGVRQPPEVLPAGNRAGLPANTIVCGHQRVRALRVIGKREAEVLVLADLADASREEVEQRFLSDNLLRRHLGPLAQVRAAVRLCAIEKRRRGGSGEVRERVGALMGLSGRSVDRYLKVAKAPIEVQEALGRDEVRFVDAVRVSGLDERSKAALARAIRNGAPPAEAVAAVLKKPATKVAKKPSVPDFRRLARSLEAVIAEVNGWVEESAGLIYGQRDAVRQSRAKLLQLADLFDTLP